MSPGFTPLYEWVIEETDSLAEAAIICRVLRWGKGGCYESNARLGRKLNMHPRTIQRLIKGLVNKEWLALLYPQPQHRVMYVNPRRLTPGPLFDIAVSKIKAYGTTPQVKNIKSAILRRNATQL